VKPVGRKVLILFEESNFQTDFPNFSPLPGAITKKVADQRTESRKS
jgi:hypothetical protein